MDIERKYIIWTKAKEIMALYWSLRWSSLKNYCALSMKYGIKADRVTQRKYSMKA